MMKKTALKYGLLTGIGMVAISVIYYVADSEQNWMGNMIISLILLGGIIYGLKIYRNDILDGYIKYGKAVGFGVLLSVFAGLVVVFHSLLYYSVINPDVIQDLLLDAQRRLIEMNVSDYEIDMFMSLYRRFIFTPLSISIMSLISYVFYGTIFSLIAAAFLKKEEPFNHEV